MPAFPLQNEFFILLVLAGVLGIIFFVKNRSGKRGKKTPFLLVSLALVAAGLLGSFFFQPPQVSIPSATQPQASVQQDLLEEAKLLSTESQVFTQTIQPLVCDQGNLTYWRELRVYNVTRQNQTRTFSTVTLFVKNVGEKAVKNVVVKEKLPEQIAKTPEEIIGFSVTPFAFEKGSVVVDWLFESIDPGETKSVSYTVEKDLEPGILGEFDAPQSVSTTTGQAVAQAAPQKAQPFDYTIVGLVFVAVILGAVIVLFSRRQ
ncbi:MAG: hypothetical protein V1717_02260 [Candidatus Micrarchaeota archaeon]